MDVEVICTTRFQWQESQACGGGSARDLLLAQRIILDHANILNAMPASIYQQSLGSRIPKRPTDHLSRNRKMSTTWRDQEDSTRNWPASEQKIITSNSSSVLSFHHLVRVTYIHTLTNPQRDLAPPLKNVLFVRTYVGEAAPAKAFTTPTFSLTPGGARWAPLQKL